MQAAADPSMTLRRQQARAAGRYLSMQPHPAPEDLGPLLDSCAAHLFETFGLSAKEASDLALAAWAERAAAGTSCRFDLEASTPYLVYIADPVTGRRRALSVVDILRLMGPRAVPGSTPSA